MSDKKVQEVRFYWQREEKLGPLIAMKASKLLCQGCVGYWCYAIDIQEKKETVEVMPVVCKFKDVFHEE